MSTICQCCGSNLGWRQGDGEFGTMAFPIRKEVFDLVKHLAQQREFSLKTFGPGEKFEAVIKHIRKELIEIEADPKDLFEWIDVILLAFDGAHRAGHTPDQIVAAIEKKQAINEARDWPDWRTVPEGEPITHNKI